jgi:hypothetical protein
MAQPTTPRPKSSATQRPQTTPRARSTKSTSSSGAPRPFNMPFESKNINIILIGVGVIALGYFLMGSGDALSTVSLGISPWVLILGYLVVVPFGIMYGARRMKTVRAAAAASEQPQA